MSLARSFTLLAFTGLAAACPGRQTPGDEDGGTGSSSTSTDSTGTGDTSSGSSSTGDELLPPPYDPLPGRPDLDARRPCGIGVHVFVDEAGGCDDHTPCYRRIQEAIDGAPGGATVWVFPGTYTRGSDAYVIDDWRYDEGRCIRSVEGPAETILEGEEKGAIVVARNAWIEGFTLRGVGRAHDSWVFDGWTMWIQGPRGYAVGNRFESNRMGQGGLYFAADDIDVDALFSGNLFRDNLAVVDGGGASLMIDIASIGEKPGRIRVENNVFIANQGTALFFFQFLYFDLPLGVTGLPAQVVNNTITGSDRGILGPFEGLSVHSNVVAGNVVDVERFDAPKAIHVGHNLFSNAPQYIGIDGNVVGDPGFVDAAAGDVRIRGDSSAQGLADPALAPAFDFDGTPRDPMNPDAGAYEVDAP